MHQRRVDVCISWSKQARYPQNIVFVPRRFSRRWALRFFFVFLRLAAFKQRCALPARRFTHAFRVPHRTFWLSTVLSSVREAPSSAFICFGPERVITPNHSYGFHVSGAFPVGIPYSHVPDLEGTPGGLEYTFSSALFVTTRPLHILVFDAYIPRYICICLRCSLIAFSASWSRSMCKFQQFPFEITRAQGVPLMGPYKAKCLIRTRKNSNCNALFQG